MAGSRLKSFRQRRHDSPTVGASEAGTGSSVVPQPATRMTRSAWGMGSEGNRSPELRRSNLMFPAPSLRIQATPDGICVKGPADIYTGNDTHGWPGSAVAVALARWPVVF